MPVVSILLKKDPVSFLMKEAIWCFSEESKSLSEPMILLRDTFYPEKVLFLREYFGGEGMPTSFLSSIKKLGTPFSKSASTVPGFYFPFKDWRMLLWVRVLAKRTSFARLGGVTGASVTFLFFLLTLTLELFEAILF